MKPSTKDKAQGTFHEVKGKVKEKIGRATNNPDLEAEGQVEKIGGKVQKKSGQVKKVLGTKLGTARRGASRSRFTRHSRRRRWQFGTPGSRGLGSSAKAS